MMVDEALLCIYMPAVTHVDVHVHYNNTIILYKINIAIIIYHENVKEMIIMIHVLSASVILIDLICMVIYTYFLLIV